MIINQLTRQTIHRIKKVKKCVCCKKRNFSSVWFYLIGESGYNSGDLTSIKDRIRCFDYVKGMFKRTGNTNHLDLIAKKHCFNCGIDIDYGVLHYSRF